jgi:hypothetical protein
VDRAEPITLDGDQVFEITGVHFVHRGDIVLRGRSRLVIRDSYFEHLHDYSFQFWLNAYDDASVEVVNSQLKSSPWLNWNFRGRSSLTQRNVDGKDSLIWHWFPEQSRGDFEDARFRGTVDGQSQVTVRHSPDLFVELVFPDHVKLDTTLPKKISRYEFPGPSDTGVPFRLVIEDSEAREWGITTQPFSDITVRDTDGVVVTISASYLWDRETVLLEGLRRERYADRTWELPKGARLRLVNTRVSGWSPIAFEKNTLVIRDSVLNDQAFSGGNATVIFERVTTQFVRAQENVRITLRDSFVEGDVLAIGTGRIELVRTKVGGKIVTEDDGVITQTP